MKVSRFGLFTAVLLVMFISFGCADTKKADTKASADKPFESCEDMAQGKAPTPQVIVGGIHYGPVFKLADKDAVSVSKVIADPAAYNGKEVRLTGKVAEVCAVKGCWLTFGDAKNTETVFVKFVDPAAGRLVPVKAIGHEIVAEGTFKVGQISQDFARHLVIDGGGTQEEASKIVGPQKKLLLMTPSVTITGLQ